MNGSDYTQNRAELLYTAVQQHRIGSRITDGDASYTLVALNLGSTGVRPLYLGDDDINQRPDFLTLDEIGDVTPLADDAAISQTARVYAVKEREAVNSNGHLDTLWDNPRSAEEIQQVLEYGEADRAWRIAERAQREAAQARAISIARIAWATGKQTATGRLLGLDQSRVSRAVETARAVTGGDTT